jgi:fumarate reductase flavoprotein subunit
MLDRRWVIVNRGSAFQDENLEADIVVIGGGGTGLAAAVSAAEKGARVILLEKRGLGGNSALAQGLFAADSPVQKRMNISAPKDEAFRIVLEYSHWKINPRIFRSFLNKSGDTIRWLEEKGLVFIENTESRPGEISWFHLPGGITGGGVRIIKALSQKCEELGAQLFIRCPARRILTNEKGKVTGVLAAMKGKELRISAKSVIIATGGYGGNKRLLKKYYPSYNKNIHSVGVPNMGDGLLMANEVGAANEGLGNALLHPHVFLGSKYIGALSWQPYSVWVNKRGVRFADETIIYRSPECGNVADRQPDKCVHVLIDEKIKKSLVEDGLVRRMPWLNLDEKNYRTKLEEGLQEAVDKGDVKISASWDDIATWIGASPEVLNDTIEEYNSFCDQGYDEIFIKDQRYLQALRTPPYYAIRCYLSLMTTIGGIKINHHMEVLNKHDNPIPGLYAGGDCAGGWETDTYCMLLPGSALGFAINSGRIAGVNAAKYVLGK